MGIQCSGRCRSDVGSRHGFCSSSGNSRSNAETLDHPVYGYTHHSKELKDAIVSWVGRRYHWDIQSEWLGFSPGVVPALVMSLLSLTTPGDRIVIMTPVYHPFYSSIEENGRVIINHQLDCDENGRYSINFERLEARSTTAAKRS